MAGVSEEELRTVRFEPEMIPACARIYLDVYTNEPWNETVESAEAVERFFRRHAAGGEFIGYALLSGGRPAGFAIGFAKPWIRGVEFYLDEETQTFFAEAVFPEKIEGAHDLFEALSLDDLNGDGDSDVQLMLTGQTLIWYYDAASESYVYQPQT